MSFKNEKIGIAVIALADLKPLFESKRRLPEFYAMLVALTRVAPDDAKAIEPYSGIAAPNRIQPRPARIVDVHNKALALADADCPTCGDKKVKPKELSSAKEASKPKKAKKPELSKDAVLKLMDIEDCSAENFLLIFNGLEETQRLPAARLYAGVLDVELNKTDTLEQITEKLAKAIAE